MLLFRFFGLLDLIAAAVLLLAHFGWFETTMAILAVLLILKGLLYFSDFVSKLDMAIGVYSLAVVLGLQVGITFAVALYLALKGAQSLYAF